MSELKESYMELGYKEENLENNLMYLAELALSGAIEIDNYILGRDNDFSHLQELTEILKKYQLKDSDNALSAPDFLYIPLWRAMRKDSEKEIKTYSELGLEMKLLRADLERIPENEDRIKELISFLCDLSKEFLYEERIYTQSYKLVA